MRTKAPATRRRRNGLRRRTLWLSSARPVALWSGAWDAPPPPLSSRPRRGSGRRARGRFGRILMRGRGLTLRPGLRPLAFAIAAPHVGPLRGPPLRRVILLCPALGRPRSAARVPRAPRSARGRLLRPLLRPPRPASRRPPSGLPPLGLWAPPAVPLGPIVLPPFLDRGRLRRGTILPVMLDGPPAFPPLRQPRGPGSIFARPRAPGARRRLCGPAPVSASGGAYAAAAAFPGPTARPDAAARATGPRSKRSFGSRLCIEKSTGGGLRLRPWPGVRN